MGLRFSNQGADIDACVDKAANIQNEISKDFEERVTANFAHYSASNSGYTQSVEEGYGIIVLNPNENYIEVEKTKAQQQPSPDSSDEPAEKKERKDRIPKDTKKRRDFYEKYRNPQKEKETMQIFIRLDPSFQDNTEVLMNMLGMVAQAVANFLGDSIVQPTYMHFFHNSKNRVE
ncbi:putative Protein FAM172A protein [Naja naja]|nr:putative Protein FAM172A protein [Naja naja]